VALLIAQPKCCRELTVAQMPFRNVRKLPGLILQRKAAEGSESAAFRVERYSGGAGCRPEYVKVEPTQGETNGYCRGTTNGVAA
jgi:hypothetical protein